MAGDLAPQRATDRDRAAIVETIALAFANDPVWSPTLAGPGSDHGRIAHFADVLVRGALRHPCSWLLDGAAAVAIWIPPGGTELTDDEISGLDRWAERAIGPDGPSRLHAAFEPFAEAHPHGEPHYYLSVLATHPGWRGLGLGMGLLRSNLERIDREGIPSYLESTNPANDRRYESVGYRTVTRFALPAGQVVAGMWRPVGG